MSSWIHGFLVFAATWPYILIVSIRKKSLKSFVSCILILMGNFTFPDSLIPAIQAQRCNIKGNIFCIWKYLRKSRTRQFVDMADICVLNQADEMLLLEFCFVNYMMILEISMQFLLTCLCLHFPFLYSHIIYKYKLKYLYLHN